MTPTTSGGDESDIGAFEHLPYVNNDAGNALADSGAGSLRDTFALVPADTFVIFDPDFFGNSLTTGHCSHHQLERRTNHTRQEHLNRRDDRQRANDSQHCRRQRNQPCLFVSSGFTVELSGMTVTGGNATAQRRRNFQLGTLTLRFVHVTGNTASDFGGGIANGGGTLNVYHSTVSNNTANPNSGTGGGIDSGSAH